MSSINRTHFAALPDLDLNMLGPVSVLFEIFSELVTPDCDQDHHHVKYRSLAIPASEMSKEIQLLMQGYQSELSWLELELQGLLSASF